MHQGKTAFVVDMGLNRWGKFQGDQRRVGFVTGTWQIRQLLRLHPLTTSGFYNGVEVINSQQKLYFLG